MLDCKGFGGPPRTGCRVSEQSSGRRSRMLDIHRCRVMVSDCAVVIIQCSSSRSTVAVKG